MNKNLRMIVSFIGNDKLSGSLRSIIGLGQTGSQKLALMKRNARDLEGELRGVQREMRGSTGNVTELMNRETDLERRIARTNGEMERQVKLLAASNRASAVRAKGDALKSSGQGNVAAGVGLAGSLYLAAKGGMDFQSGMTDIALKANLTAKQTALMQGNIVAAARAARQLPEDMRAGVDVLAGFGMTPQQAAQMVGPIGKVATAYRAEIADLSAAAFANFQNLKVPISENAKALEVMASAGNAGAFEIKDMAQYFPSLTAQAQAFGQHGVGAVADLAAAAQIARKATGDSSSAANNLENLMAKINTEDTIKKFKEFGIDLPASMKKAYAQGKTPLEAIAELSKKAVGGDLSKLSFLFGDMQAQSALRPLIQNMEEYRRIRSEALASKGAVDAAFARRSEDAAVQTRALVGNLQRLAITAGPILLPAMIRVSQILLSVTDRIGQFIEANPRAASAVMQLVAGLAALKIGLGVGQIVTGALLGPLGSIISIAPKVATAFGIIRSAGMLLLANPVVLAIVAVVAVLGGAAYMIYKHWSAISGYFSQNWTYIRNLMLGAMVIFTPWLAAIVFVAKKVYDNWGAISAGIGKAVSTIWAYVRPAVAPLLSLISIIQGLQIRFLSVGLNLMRGLLSGIWQGAKSVLSAVVNIAGRIGATFAKALGIKSPSRVFMGLGGHITDGLAMGLQRGQGSALQAVQRIASGVAGVSMAISPAAVASAGPSPRLGGVQAIEARANVMPELTPIRRFATATGERSRAMGSGNMGGINFGGITIHAAPGQSPQDIAAAVRAELDRMASQAAASARSAYVDD